MCPPGPIPGGQAKIALPVWTVNVLMRVIGGDLVQKRDHLPARVACKRDEEQATADLVAAVIDCTGGDPASERIATPEDALTNIHVRAGYPNVGLGRDHRVPLHIGGREVHQVVLMASAEWHPHPPPPFTDPAPAHHTSAVV